MSPMRRHHTNVTPLRGQVLFADMDAGTLTVDCILAKSGGTGAPVTFSARFPGRGHAPERAIELLFRWAAEAAAVEVRITDGKAGPQVEIACATWRVVLESDEAEAA